MPLVTPAIYSELKSEIFNNLKALFSGDTSKGQNYSPLADEMLMKIADAVANGVAKVMVEHITTNAQVVPGQTVVGVGGGVPGPVNGATVSPGKII